MCVVECKTKNQSGRTSCGVSADAASPAAGAAAGLAAGAGVPGAAVLALRGGGSGDCGGEEAETRLSTSFSIRLPSRPGGRRMSWRALALRRTPGLALR